MSSEFKQDIQVAVDVVVFGYRRRDLQVLLHERAAEPHRGELALPGVFLRNNESATEAVRRCMRDKAGTEISWFEQLYSFTHPARDPRGRVISVAYYCLVRPEDTTTSRGVWCSLDSVSRLAFDHADIVDYALSRLQNKIRYQPVGFDLLPPKFPFSAVTDLYQTILRRPVTDDGDDRNFKRKFMKLGFLRKLDEKETDVPHRPGWLYSFDKAAYDRVADDGFYLQM